MRIHSHHALFGGCYNSLRSVWQATLSRFNVCVLRVDDVFTVELTPKAQVADAVVYDFAALRMKASDDDLREVHRLYGHMTLDSFKDIALWKGATPIASDIQARAQCVCEYKCG